MHKALHCWASISPFTNTRISVPQRNLASQPLLPCPDTTPLQQLCTHEATPFFLTTYSSALSPPENDLLCRDTVSVRCEAFSR